MAEDTKKLLLQAGSVRKSLVLYVQEKVFREIRHCIYK